MRLAGLLFPLFLLFLIGNGLVVFLDREHTLHAITSFLYKPSKHPDLRFTLRALIFGQPEEINAQGFRTKPFSPKTNASRILLLGDSIFFGDHLKKPDTFAEQIEVGLSQQGLQSEVYNLAIPAYTMSQKWASYRIYGKDLKPDIVLLQTHPKDFLDFEDIVVTGLQRLPLVFWMKHRIYSKMPHTATWDDGFQDYLQLKKACESHNIPFCVVYFPFLVQHPFDDDYQKDLDAYTRSGTTVVEVSKFLSAQGRDLESFRVNPQDVIHPNPEANRIIAHDLLPWLIHHLGAAH